MPRILFRRFTRLAAKHVGRLQSERPAIAVALLCVGLSVAWSSFLFAPFTAEDAYILYRYVENFHRLGALVYNQDEPVSSLTSPLHAILLSAVYGFSSETVVTNKVLGALVLLIVAAAIASRFRDDRLRLALALALGIAPTCVPFWTFGGLETPFLMGLATLATLLITKRGPRGSYTYLVAAACGIGFLARYDAALFFGPIGLCALWLEPQRRRQLWGAALGIGPGLCWMAIALLYYGDIFPTSFYIKTPNLEADTILRNAHYVLAWLFYTGLLPVLLIVWPKPLQQLPGGAASGRHKWGAASVWSGLALTLFYTLTMATEHMMFAFRAFAAYVPAAAILIAQAMPSRDTFPEPRHSLPWVSGIAALAFFQAFHSWLIHRYSLNGLSPVGEYTAIGARDMSRAFMPMLGEQADAIARDWPMRRPSRERPARVSTYVGGLVPWRLPDFYFYETLASYRHGEDHLRGFSVHADYIMTLTPLFGPIPAQLEGVKVHERIYEKELLFDGLRAVFAVYYNPAPLPHVLGPRVDQPHLEPSR
jgi:arabinofuranosyltransferase